MPCPKHVLEEPADGRGIPGSREHAEHERLRAVA